MIDTILMKTRKSVHSKYVVIAVMVVKNIKREHCLFIFARTVGFRATTNETATDGNRAAAQCAANQKC